MSKTFHRYHDDHDGWGIERPRLMIQWLPWLREWGIGSTENQAYIGWRGMHISFYYGFGLLIRWQQRRGWDK